jgi:hypothetical protein
MKGLILFFLVVAMTTKVLAQDNTSAPPQGPMIDTKMPEQAQWTIDFTYANAPKPGAVSPQLAYYQQQAKIDPLVAKQMQNPAFVAALSPVRPVHILVVKTAGVWHIEEDLEGGKQAEEWRTFQVTATKAPSMEKFNVVLDDNASRVDFPEFFWIAAGNYAGPGSDGGQKTLVFKSKVDPVIIHFPGRTGGEPVPCEARIDWKTRYPVYFQFGDETRHYTYLAPPTEALELPSEIAATATAALKKIQQLTPTPSNR